MSQTLTGNTLKVEGGTTEHVEDFQWLSSVIYENGKMDTEIGGRLGNAAKELGALRGAVFSDKVLTTNSKRKIYQASVLSVLLYGGECWIPLR